MLTRIFNKIKPFFQRNRTYNLGQYLFGKILEDCGQRESLGQKFCIATIRFNDGRAVKVALDTEVNPKPGNWITGRVFFPVFNNDGEPFDPVVKHEDSMPLLSFVEESSEPPSLPRRHSLIRRALGV
jgi:hypothetical protein